MKNISIISISFILLLSGCITSDSLVSVSPYADLKSIKTIIVWPFLDGGNTSNSGSIATRAFEQELMLKGYRLISYSKMKDVLSVEVGFKDGMSFNAGLLTNEVRKILKNDTGVDAIMLGSVSNANCNAAWLPPCGIETAFQVIDIDTGEIIISGNASDYASSIHKAANQMVVKALKKF